MPFSDTAAVRSLILHSPEECARLGTVFAGIVTAVNPGALLLYGTLGAGKTTLCRAIVGSLPGGDRAEIASPSFTICNIYSTQPAVHHFDLYRITPGTGDEALDESFDDPSVLSLVEWSEHLAPGEHPQDGLALRLTPESASQIRKVEFAALGPLGTNFLTRLWDNVLLYPLS